MLRRHSKKSKACGKRVKTMTKNDVYGIDTFNDVDLLLSWPLMSSAVTA